MSSSPPPRSDKPVEQFSKDINSGMEILQKAQKESNSIVVELDKSYAAMEAERSDWEDEKTIIANTQKFDSHSLISTLGVQDILLDWKLYRDIRNQC